MPTQKLNLATTLANLVATLIIHGDLNEAEAFLQEGFALHRQMLGENNVYVANDIGKIARLRIYQGRYLEAATEARKALNMQKTMLPESHVNNALPLLSLGYALTKQEGKSQQSEIYLRRALRIMQQAYAANNWRIYDAESQLGECLTNQHRFTEAKPLLLNGHERLKTIMGENHRMTNEALERIAKFYERSAQFDKAAEGRK